MNKNDASMHYAHESFRKIVDRCHKHNLDQWIPNSATTHAAYLLHKLLQAAAKHKRRIRIISGGLDRRVYDQLTDALQECINADVPMEVVVLDGVDGIHEGGNEFYRHLRAYSKANCYAPKADGGKINMPHMLVAGDRSFRYETDPESHKAVANFNNQLVAKMLNKHFDRLIAEGPVEAAVV